MGRGAWRAVKRSRASIGCSILSMHLAVSGWLEGLMGLFLTLLANRRMARLIGV